MKFGLEPQQKKLVNVNRTGIIILARFNSKRLPGKALRLVGKKKLLEHVVSRLEAVFQRDQILIATSENSTDDPIASFAETMGVNCYRGSLDKVGERFYAAACAHNFDTVVRVNGDNVLLDPFLIKEMLGIFEENKFDFMSNVKGRTFPKGVSVEIVRTEYYGTFLDSIKSDPFYNEHVMPIFYESERTNHFYFYNEKVKDCDGVDLSLDEQADLDRTVWMLVRLEDRLDLKSTIDIYKVYEKEF